MSPDRGHFGDSVSSEVISSADPAQYVVLTNNDYEEHDDFSAKDLDDTTALITDDQANTDPTTGKVIDDDLAQITIKKVPESFPNGSAEIQLSDPTAARLFTSNGAELTQRNLSLSSPSGYLASLASGDVDLWLEGLHKNPDFVFTVIYKDQYGREVKREAVHMLLAEWKTVGADGSDAKVANVDLENVRAQSAGDPTVMPSGATPDYLYRFKTVIDGLPSEDIQELRTTSDDVPGDYVVEDVGSDSLASTSSDYTALYFDSDSSGSPLTQSERAQIKQQLQVNLVHNESATTQATAKSGDVQSRPVKLSARQTLVRAIRDEEHRQSPYAYYALVGFDKLFPREIAAVQNHSVVTKVKRYPSKGIPGHPDATALTENGSGGTSVVSITPNVNSFDAVHEVIHVLQNQGQFPAGGNAGVGPDEAEAWAVAQEGLGRAAGLKKIEQAIKAHDQAKVELNWQSAWVGAQGFSGLVGFVVTNDGYKIQVSDLQNIFDDLGIRYSCTALAERYNALLKRAGMAADLTMPAGLPAILQ